MGIFDDIKDAKASMDSDYVRPGEYLFRIDGAKRDKSRKGDEFACLEMTCVHVFDDNNGAGHRVGNTPTHMLMAKHDSFLGNIKAMISSIMDCDPEEIGPEQAQTVFSGVSTPLKGLVVHVLATNIKTKKNTDFTRVGYKGTVSGEQLKGILSQEVIELHFPQGV